ncbi:hypothetical protein ACWD4F_40920 [Streptomyces aureus]
MALRVRVVVWVQTSARVWVPVVVWAVRPRVMAVVLGSCGALVVLVVSVVSRAVV